MTPDPRDTPEFRAYLRAREHVLRMKGSEASGTGGPSAYWIEELDNIDYIADASPTIVRKLRHHAFHITGLRPYDYRRTDDNRRGHFEARFSALRALGGDALLVPESPALGGFGFEIDGRVVNIDTLKFYEVLIGMERGGVLGSMRAIDRPVVCEIGPGWGGFAYQFKTLVPRATYVLVDFPELFLFSATYLSVVFPDARMVFADLGANASIDGWRDADFVFIPYTHSDLISTLPLNLTVNMVSFQEMTEAQVRGYAAMAARAGCPLLYSLNRERSRYNPELVSVSDALAEHYMLTEVPMLDTDYTTAMKKAPRPARMSERSEVVYRHQVGRLDPSRRPGVSGVAPATKATPQAPRVVLGMTLYNKASHLREALESLLTQTYGDFALVLLDDASRDDTEAIARAYEARDPRVRYFRHESRQAMIATWREVAELASREYPSAPYFAWVSDHDRWHPRWLERLIGELDRHPQAVLAYPVTQRITPAGVEIDKGPRYFDAVDLTDPRERWARFCDEGVGSGDMVYGLVRAGAMRRAGIFRTVLRPDRLFVAEMALQGEIRQVREVLWYRRLFDETSIARQRQTLVLPGTAPSLFRWPPWVQHSIVLYREYAKAAPMPDLPIGRNEWLIMIARYQFSYAWRHLRKSETSHWFARTVKRVIWSWKMTKHHYRHAVYDTLVGLRTFRGKARRKFRHGVYNVLVARNRVTKEIRSGALGVWAAVRRAGRRGVHRVLVFSHRAGLRGRDQTP